MKGVEWCLRCEPTFWKIFIPFNFAKEAGCRKTFPYMTSLWGKFSCLWNGAGGGATRISRERGHNLETSQHKVHEARDAKPSPSMTLNLGERPAPMIGQGVQLVPKVRKNKIFVILPSASTLLRRPKVVKRFPSMTFFLWGKFPGHWNVGKGWSHKNFPWERSHPRNIPHQKVHKARDAETSTSATFTHEGIKNCFHFTRNGGRELNGKQMWNKIWEIFPPLLFC